MFNSGFLFNMTRSVFGSKATAECGAKTPEEEAKEFEQLMQSENGGMPQDPEEMQEFLAKMRGTKNRKPPQFQ